MRALILLPMSEVAFFSTIHNTKNTIDTKKNAIVIIKNIKNIISLSFADALRTDGHAWRQLKPQDPRIKELRLLCRDEIDLIGQRTAFVNQLREALKEYYPAALEAFDDWTSPAPWDFIQQFSTPQALEKAGKRRWEKFLHTHRLYDTRTYKPTFPI